MSLPKPPIKLVLVWLVAIFVVWYIFSRPEAAGMNAGVILDTIGKAFVSLFKFFEALGRAFD